jgi:hypothetical protein
MIGVLLSACSQVRVSCSPVGDRSFDVLDFSSGGDLSRDEFLGTPQGQALEAFFTGGDGQPENESFVTAGAFTILSGDYVVGFDDRWPSSYYRLDNGRVSSWGGCQPVLVRGDQVARRWVPASPPEPDATSIPILVEGGGCSEDGGIVTSTEIVELHVQDEDAVVITVWTRETNRLRGCAGVDIQITAEAVLSGPLGNRQLLDGGLLPPSPVHP